MSIVFYSIFVSYHRFQIMVFIPSFSYHRFHIIQPPESLRPLRASRRGAASAHMLPVLPVLCAISRVTETQVLTHRFITKEDLHCSVA